MNESNSYHSDITDMSPGSSGASELHLLPRGQASGSAGQSPLFRAKKGPSSLLSRYALAFRRLLRQQIIRNKVIGIPYGRLDRSLSRSITYRIIDDVPIAGNTQTHDVYWSQKYETGYKYDAFGRRVPIHDEFEDVSSIVVEDFDAVTRQTPCKSCNIPMQIYTRSSLGSSNGSKMFLFVLADGHGGLKAAKFFVSKAQQAITLLVESRKWDLSVQRERSIFEKEITKVFTSLDAMFVAQKIEEYKAWNEQQKGNMDGSPRDTNQKPVDDGCTLVVNLIFQNYLINANTGDSRTIVALKDKGGSPLKLVFMSRDHNMSHREKVKHAHVNGGKFVSREGVIAKLSPSKDDAMGNSCGGKSFRSGPGLRLCRPPNKVVKDLSLSCNRTLNLSAAMGDLLFKVDPCIVSCAPDVNFVHLSQDAEYIIIIATDGVWDHIDISRNYRFENVANAREMYESDIYYDAHADLTLELAEELLFGGCHCKGGENTVKYHHFPRPPGHQLSGACESVDSLRSLTKKNVEDLEKFVSAMTIREPETHMCECTKDFFYKKLSRYDDSTCIAVWAKPKK